MDTRTVAFGPSTAPSIRGRLRRLLRVPDPGDGPPFEPRLIVSPVDPSDAVRRLEHLRLKPGLVLRGYQFIDGGNGNGFVFAVPESSVPGDPRDDVRRRKMVVPGVALPCPEPPDALPHFMDAIEGDGSPGAFLEASLLMRELYEFGALWHGCSWDLHEIVCANPLHPAAVLRGELKQVCGEWRDQWTWLVEPPADWRPRVTLGPERATVQFFSVRLMEGCRIVRHADTYRPGSMLPECADHVIAEGPPGAIP